MISERFKYDRRPTLHLNKIQIKSRDAVDQKVDKGIYKFEKVDCVICKGTDLQLISEQDRYGLKMSVVICKSCGLVQTNPRMDQESYNQFYNNEYRPLYVGKENPTAYFFQRQYEKGKVIFNYLKRNNALPKSSSPFVLEVGCGAGGILQFFKDQGFSTFGTDLGEAYLEYGRLKGLNLAHGFLRDQKLENKPDLIIYSHVVEHLLDPNEEISYLREIAHINTILYIEVPGILNLKKPYKHDYMRYVQNAHTYHFSFCSLKNLLNKNGFKCISGNENIQSIFELNSSNEKPTEINNCYEETIQYLNNLEKDRNRLPFYPYSVSLYWLQKDIKNFILLLLEKLGIRSYIKRIRKQLNI